MTNYEKPYKFNIVLNSQQTSTFSSGNPNNCTYEFNWSNIPRGKYRMSFSYRGANNADFVANDSPQVFVGLESVPSCYQSSGQNGSVVSRFVGTLRAETHAAAQIYFYANLNDNPDVYFDSRPANGLIQVLVYRDDFVTPFTTIAGSNLANYVMVLSFEQVGKVDGYNV